MFRAIIVDYLPTWQVPTARKIFEWLLRIGTVVVGVGFYEFETNDVSCSVPSGNVSTTTVGFQCLSTNASCPSLHGKDNAALFKFTTPFPLALSELFLLPLICANKK